MVRPVKLSDEKGNLSNERKTATKASNATGDRYRTEAPNKKKLKSKKPSLVPASPKKPKEKLKSTSLSKNMKILNSAKVPLVAKAKTEQQLKVLHPKKILTTNPLFAEIDEKYIRETIKSPLRKLNQSLESDITSLPHGEPIMKQYLDRDLKANLKKKDAGSPRNSLKDTKLPAKQKSSLSMKNHYYTYDLVNETVSESKSKLKPDSAHKKSIKPKGKTSSKTKKLKSTGKTKKTASGSNLVPNLPSLSCDSVCTFPLREIKHNDSFVISARKLQTTGKGRRAAKPECIKLQKRSTLTRMKPKSNKLKSCLKKDALEKEK